MHRRALGLLLAASALPFTPAFAQEQPTGAAPPPIVDTSPPPVTTPAPEATTPPPLVTTPPPAVTPAPVVTTPAPTIVTETATTPARSTTPTRSTRTTTTRTATRQAAPRSAAATAAPAAAASVPATPAPLAAQPAPAAEPAPLPVETLPVETLPADTATTADTGGSNGLPTWAWLLAGLALAGIIVALLTRRRRSVVEEDYVVEEPAVYAEPVRAEGPADFGADYQAPIVAPAMMAAAPIAASFEAGEPQIEFEMRPVRAGVGEDDARVDFQLGVANRGTAAARDVRVSAWMLGANSPARSEAEDALIERVDIDAGEDANVEASVGLPRSGLSQDAIIPVVVAEATYTRPDGSEGRTTATYQVGVPDDGNGGEMIYFDVENPSGLHGGVVAREIEELERA